MGKVRTVAPAAQAPAAAAAKVKRPAAAPAPAAKVKKAAAPVIEIPSSPDTPKGSGKKRRRKRQAPLDLDGVEMWTPRERRRLDDDCQILSGDPVAAAAAAPAAAAAAGDGDIVVVAELGKVACRDYPHPRSACAKHPFGTTPHERHCAQLVSAMCATSQPHVCLGLVLRGIATLRTRTKGGRH
ncbi:hypothetical protein ACP4OV_003946 [Aristida adscensionis]